MLNERSIAVQHQLAEQAAADADATGVKKILGDFWATGMDEAKINAQGITPLQDRLDAIAKLDGSEAIAEYLRTSAARGENFLFGFGSVRTEVHPSELQALMRKPFCITRYKTKKSR